MRKFLEFGSALRKNLQSILQGEFTHQQLHEVIALSHSFAIILLRKKLSSGKLNLHLVHMDVHDIAYDCIAELFRMDGELPLIQIRAYFSGLNIDTASDKELIDHLRRLVFSKINQGVFRLYQEYDPSLSKILRNLKIAIQSLNSFVEADRFGELYIVPAAVREQFDKPTMNQDDLEMFLHTILKGKERIPDILAAVSLHMQQQQQFAKAVPLVGLAVALRKTFTDESVTTVSTNNETSNETDSLLHINRACSDVHTKMYESYVGKKKLERKEYDAMFEVIKKNLTAIVIDRDGLDFSLYDHLRMEMKTLTKVTYRKKYRPILEYLYGMTKKDLGKSLQRDL